MNYLKIYNDLIIRGRDRTLQGYKEQHHIIPKCLGGSNNIDNLVYLTAEEHYVAHQLLVKIYPDNRKLIHAAGMMCVSGSLQERSKNKQYGWIKRKLSVIRSEMMTGENSPNYGKPGHFSGCKHTEESKKKISLSAKGRILGPLSKEIKEKISASNKGKHSMPKSTETKRKISESQKGKPWSQSRRELENKKDIESNSLFKKLSMPLLLSTVDYD